MENGELAAAFGVVEPGLYLFFIYCGLCGAICHVGNILSGGIFLIF